MKKKAAPPGLAVKLLLHFLRDDLAEEVIGDLEEQFYLTLESRSLFRARMDYWRQVFNYLRPFALRKSKHTTINHSVMYQSYLKTAVRSMRKNKMLAAINITGLSIGMAVSMTLGLWIWDEWSYNKQYTHHDRIAQVIQNVTNNGQVATWKAIPWPLADELRKNYGSDFEQVVLITQPQRELLVVGDKKLNKQGRYAEPGFFELFSAKMLSGNPDGLNDPSSIYLSASTAKAYFAETDPINKIIEVAGSPPRTLHVAGVYEDFPQPSDLPATEFIAPWTILGSSPGITQMQDPWRPNAFELYVRVKDFADFKSASAKIKDAKLKKVNEQLAKKKPELFLHPMNDWHLYQAFKDGKNVGGRIQYVWLFGIIGVFVLLMACINFMNLTTARSEQRAKEVGIRKSIGSLRGQLVAQFFSESVMISLVSFCIALILVVLALPAFNLLAEKQITIAWSNPSFWAIVLGFCLLTGLISGSYPALYLSSIQPGKALKGSYRAGSSAAISRKALVVLQFAISVILIVGTVTVYRQIEYARNRPVGYDRSALITVPVMTDNLHKHMDAFRTELLKSGAVVSVAEAGAPPTGMSGSTSGISWQGKDPNLSTDFAAFAGSVEYGKTVGWEIKEGRDFQPGNLADSSSVIINESAAAFMGLKEPVGEVIQWWDRQITIIGVIHNMVYNSPYDPVNPSVYVLSGDPGILIMKLSPTLSLSESTSKIESIVKQFSPDEPFGYQFADVDYANKFGAEHRVGKLSSIFTSLAIFISCLGIFGLASFVAEQRTKEIGVRKVLGASVFDLWKMLSRDYVLLVIFSCVVAMPVAYFVMNSWLANYTYRTAFPWWVLIAASAATLVITLVTVSYHTLNAANMKPVKSLRSE